MTEPSSPPAPADQAIAQSAFPEPDVQLWVMFVSPATQDNYSQIARDQAAIRGVEPRQVMQELAEQWRGLHERQPLDGYDHLAQWAEQHDPTAGGGPSGLTVLAARTLESARRDPYQAVTGDQAFVEQGVAAQRAQDEAVATATAAPSVDPASGMLPGAGPLPVPTDVQAGSDDPNVAQQQAAAEQRDPGEQLPDGSGAPATDTGSPPPADAPAPDAGTTDTPTTDASTPDTPTPPATSGKSGKGSSSS